MKYALSKNIKKQSAAFFTAGLIAAFVPLLAYAQQGTNVFAPLQTRWETLTGILRPLFILFDIGLIAFIIRTLIRYNGVLREHAETADKKETKLHIVTPKKEVEQSWEHIRGLTESPHASDWNMAVLRADALLDEILIRMGYEGEGLADRLKIMDPARMPSLERIWSAHRLRNAIAHDPMEQHTKETIMHALHSFEQGLKELGLLEEKAKT